jgi:nitrate reductase NapE component
MNILNFVYFQTENTNEKAVDKQEHNGPLEKRSCTDVLCLLLFVAFIVVWGFVGAYGKLNLGLVT